MSTYNKTKIADLEKNKEYSKDIIEWLKRGQIDKIGDLPLEERSNKDFILPILYTVKNEYNSYKVYSHIAPSLQCDESLTLEVIESEPGLIEGTPLAADKNFIEKYMNRYPEITKYMDETLQVYPSIQRAINPEGYEIKKQTAISTMAVSMAVATYPFLANDKDYMKQSILMDASALEFLGKELKNDTEFLKEIYTENREAITYTAENVEKFGINELEVAQNIAMINVFSDAANDFKGKAEEIKNRNNEKTESEISEEDITEQRRAERHSKTMEKYLSEAIEGNPEAIKKIKRILVCCQNLDSETKEKMETVIKLSDGVLDLKRKSNKIDKNDIAEVAHTINNPENNTPVIDTVAALRDTATELLKVANELEKGGEEGVKKQGDER